MGTIHVVQIPEKQFLCMETKVKEVEDWVDVMLVTVERDISLTN